MKNRLKSMVSLLLIGMITIIPVQQASAADSKTLMDKYGEYLYANHILTERNENKFFTFIDLNGDKQKELVVSTDFSSAVYDYEDGIVQRVDLREEYSSSLYYSKEKKQYYFVESGGPYISVYTISIKNHKVTRKNEICNTIIDDYTDEYTFNGKKISYDKYNELLDKYYGSGFGYMDETVKGYKLTASNIKKYCDFTDGENSSLGKANNLDIKLEYIEEDYAYNETFLWDAVSGADGYELYRKQLDIRLDPASNSSPAWLGVEWIMLSDTKTNQCVIPKFRPGDKLDMYTVRAYKIVNGKKVYGPYSDIITTDELGAGRV